MVMGEWSMGKLQSATFTHLLDNPVTGDSSADNVTQEKLDLDPNVIQAIEENDEDTVETVLEWLTNNPQCVNAVDSDGRTALHLAVECLNVQLTRILLEAGADPCQTDVEGCTALHSLCEVGEDNDSIKINQIGDMLINKFIDIDVKNSDGCTAFHCAVRNFHNELAVRLLEEKGANITLSDNIGDTAVHIAAESSNDELLAKMIEKDPECVHLRGFEEQTPLHQAVTTGHLKTVKLILNSPSQPIDVNARSEKDETPLHCLASVADDVDSLEIGKLLVEYGAEVNPPTTTKCEKTPFHEAAVFGQSDLAMYLLEKGATVSAKAFQDILNECYENIAKAVISSDQWPIALRGTYIRHQKVTTAFRELVVKMPEVAKMVLDRCTVEGNIKMKDDKDYQVLYNYEFIEDYNKENNQTAPQLDNISPCRDSSGRTTNTGCTFTEIEQQDSCPTWGPSRFSKADHPLQLMVKTNALDLLDHPVVASLLHYKWKKYGLCGHIINLLTYAVYLCFLTAFALLVPNPQSSTCCNVSGAVGSCVTGMNLSAVNICTGPSDSLQTFIIISSCIVLLLALTRFIFELVQLVTQRLSYLTDWVNWVEIIQYICSILFVVVYGTECFCVLDWQWQIGVVAVFLGWINLILFMSKLPFVGIYVIIMIRICVTFAKLLTLTVLLIITFGVVLFMVFFDKNVSRSPFSDIPRSFLKVMTMITGELDYDAIFRLNPAGESDSLPEIAYPPISYILWIIFLILVPIVFSNMLVSLAFGDTSDVQEHARLRKLAEQSCRV